MATHDIPREQWETYLGEFSRTHQGALVSVETVDAQSDPQFEARALPLNGVSFEPKTGETGAILIHLGTEPGDHLTHTITAPKHVYHKTGAGLISDEVNAGEILEITSGGHPAITQLQLRPRPS